MFRIGILQNHPRFLKVRENIADALGLMEKSRADLWVLPEFFATGYNFKSKKEVASVAEPVSGGMTSVLLSSWAKKNNCAVVAGLPEKSGAKLYNSAVFVTGDSVSVYRKTHLFGAEKKFFSLGNTGFWTRSFKGVQLGVMICFDWFFPESARTLAIQGAQIILHPANLVLPWAPEGMKIRSLENRVFTATANRVGTERGLRYIGSSQITSPKGELLSRLDPTHAGISVISIDPSKALDKKINKANDLFKDRREKFYA